MTIENKKRIYDNIRSQVRDNLKYVTQGQGVDFFISHIDGALNSRNMMDNILAPLEIMRAVPITRDFSCAALNSEYQNRICNQDVSEIPGLNNVLRELNSLVTSEVPLVQQNDRANMMKDYQDKISSKEEFGVPAFNDFCARMDKYNSRISGEEKSE